MTIMWRRRFMKKDTLSCLLLLERWTENSPKKTLQMLILLQWLRDLASRLPVPQKCTFLVILGKSCLWICRCKDTKPSLRHFKRVLLNKYHTEKYISLKSNNINLFRKKWRMFEEKILFDK